MCTSNLGILIIPIDKKNIIDSPICLDTIRSNFSLGNLLFKIKETIRNNNLSNKEILSLKEYNELFNINDNDDSIEKDSNKIEKSNKESSIKILFHCDKIKELIIEKKERKKKPKGMMNLLNFRRQ